MGDDTPRRDGDTRQTDDSPRRSENDTTPRRRDVLRAGAAAGVLGVTGLTLNGVSAQETTTQTDGGGEGGTGVFSRSLQEGDLLRVRFRPRDPFGEPATETIPAGCLDGQSAEYQIFVVEAFRDGGNIGYRGLFAPQAAIETQTPQTTTAEGATTDEDADVTAFETTTEAAMQDEETTTAGGNLPEIVRGEWYRVTASESCDGMNRLAVETAEPPETTVGAGTTTEQADEETTTQ